MPPRPIVGKRFDPITNFKYRCIVPGFVTMGFAKISGISKESDVIEYREGTDPITARKIPGLMKFTNVVLEKGFDSNGDFRNWYLTVANILLSGNDGPDGVPDPGHRRSMDIQLYDKAGFLRKNWAFQDCWPCKYTVGDLDAKTSDILMETMEICHEGFEETPVP